MDIFNFDPFFRKVHFDRLSFFPDSAFGHYYGSQFEVHCQQLVHVDRTETSSAGKLLSFDNFTCVCVHVCAAVVYRGG